MKYDTIRWKKGRVEMLDQTLLPGKTRYISCRAAGDIARAIKTMKIRGAPAIGIAAAFGVYLGLRGSKARDVKGLRRDLRRAMDLLARSRPTARNLFWALERMGAHFEKNRRLSVPGIKEEMLREARAMLEEDKRICRKIGDNGKKLIKKGCRILTHCNAGGLATGAFGTALGVIFASRPRIKMVYADETRPVLQGARLTVLELVNAGVPATLICDNMAASIMAKKEIDAVVVGADRIASNGDTANKIGTYNLAVLARYHGIPFYVAAPASTFDLSLRGGKDIPIEERPPAEVKKINGRYITLEKVKVRNPAFDVTPAGLITAIITEKGVIPGPDKDKIRKTVL